MRRRLEHAFRLSVVWGVIHGRNVDICKEHHSKIHVYKKRGPALLWFYETMCRGRPAFNTRPLIEAHPSCGCPGRQHPALFPRPQRHRTGRRGGTDSPCGFHSLTDCNGCSWCLSPRATPASTQSPVKPRCTALLWFPKVFPYCWGKCVDSMLKCVLKCVSWADTFRS